VGCRYGKEVADSRHIKRNVNPDLAKETSIIGSE
jgi:hypothetical protein